MLKKKYNADDKSTVSSSNNKKFSSKYLILGISVIIAGILCFLSADIIAPSYKIPTLSPDKIHSEYNNKLIHLSGSINEEALTDDLFNITATGIKLERVVEFYQNSPSDQSQVWSKYIMADPDGVNNIEELISSQEWKISTYSVGSYNLSNELLVRIKEFNEPETINLTAENLAKLGEDGSKAFKLHENYFYFGPDPSIPEIGDIRISFINYKSPSLSIAAKQNGKRLDPYLYKGRNIEKIAVGNKNIEQLIGLTELQENKIHNIIIKVIAAIILLFGILLLFKFLKLKKAFNASSDSQTLDLDSTPEVNSNQTSESGKVASVVHSTMPQENEPYNEDAFNDDDDYLTDQVDIVSDEDIPPSRSQTLENNTNSTDSISNDDYIVGSDTPEIEEIPDNFGEEDNHYESKTSDTHTTNADDLLNIYSVEDVEEDEEENAEENIAESTQEDTGDILDEILDETDKTQEVGNDLPISETGDDNDQEEDEEAPLNIEPNEDAEFDNIFDPDEDEAKTEAVNRPGFAEEMQDLETYDLSLDKQENISAEETLTADIAEPDDELNMNEEDEEEPQEEDLINDDEFNPFEDLDDEDNNDENEDTNYQAFDEEDDDELDYPTPPPSSQENIITPSNVPGIDKDTLSDFLNKKNTSEPVAENKEQEYVKPAAEQPKIKEPALNAKRSTPPPPPPSKYNLKASSMAGTEPPKDEFNNLENEFTINQEDDITDLQDDDLFETQENIDDDNK